VYRQGEKHEEQRPMADHKHGNMDIEEQEKTFEGFVKAVTWASVGIVVLLILIALFNA
jgi:hypothetical protein